MIGRGCYGRPWFINQDCRIPAHRPPPGRPGAWPNSWQTLLAHYDHMMTHYGSETGVRMARKHVAWYSKGLPASAEFRAGINQMGDAAAVREQILRFYDPLLERHAA